jgi:uncharacterized membrane protein YfhO
MTQPAQALPDGASPIRSESGGGRAQLLGVLACAAAVIACEGLIFFWLFRYGVSNVWYNDGASQHFPAFVYLYDWVRAVLSGHGAGYGLWSWHLGLGADTLTTLSYYIGDPFAWLGLAFPMHMLEYVYEALFFLRVLCAGLAGYYYLRTMKAARFAAIAGTLLYTFSGFMINSTLRHTYFADALVWFPLILVGTEKVLTRKRWYLLAGALLVSAVSNFYFFYQLAIVAAIYAVARYVEITKPGERLRRLVRDGSRVGGYYALGTLLASVILVPIAIALLASSREPSLFGMPAFYSAGTYLKFFVGLFNARGGTYSLFGGFAMAGFLAAVVVFMRRGNTALKAMFVTFAVFLVFPFFGKLFNGMTFPSYRFFFTAGMFLAAGLALVLSDSRPLSRRELTVTGVGFLAVSVLGMGTTVLIRYPLLLDAVPLGIGALTWVCFAAERWFYERRGDGPERRLSLATMCRAGVVLLLVAGIAAAGVGDYSKQYNTKLVHYLPLGTVLNRYLADPGALIPSLPTDGLQRVDKQTGVLGSDLGVSQNNDPLVQGYAGLDFYYSIMDDGLHEYAKGLADRSLRFAFDIEGFDDRAALDTLAGVRYYVAPAAGAQYVPYGFAPVSKLATQTVYENRYALPVGYVYHSVVASGTYASMSPLDKQQALLQGVVVPDGVAPSVRRVTLAPEAVDETYTLTPGDGLSWDQSARDVVVHTVGASAVASFSPVPDSELYVEMTGVRFNGTTRLPITLDTGGTSKSMRFLPTSETYYWGNETMLLNLGYSASGTSHVRLTFPARRQVTYTAFHVIAVPMTRYAEQVGKLAAEGMRDVKLGADTLSGTVTSHGAGVLFLSVPYSTGWSATVDGVSTPIIQADVAFSAIAVTNGTHHVVLHYVTPGLRTGTGISVLALLLAIALGAVTERRLAAVRRRADVPGKDAEAAKPGV